jgi:Tol biopolymer transport system component/DNA-binding winged helix-turn-helix (wHTH) protein
MSHPNLPIYDFGPFRLDSAQRVLLCNGQHVPLQPKAFETLLALVERHGRIVEKEELMKRVWPDTFVEEVNLAKHVSDLRRIFRQFEPTQEFIATVPKRGYRFVADLKVREPQAETPAPEQAIASNIKTEAVNGSAPPAWPAYLPESEPEQEPEHPFTIAPQPEPSEIAAERAPIRPGFARKKILVLGLVAGLAFIAVLGYGFYRFAAPKPFLARFQNLKATRLTASGQVRGLALSPDGKYIAYLNDGSGTQSSLRLKQVVIGQEMELVQVEREARFDGLAFSPDGNYVYYSTGPSRFSTALYRVPLLGGTPRKLTAGPVNSSVTFLPTGERFAFTRDNGNSVTSELVIANADGSNEQVLATAKKPERFMFPTWSPDGKIIACSLLTSPKTSTLVAVAADSGQRTIIGVETLEGVWQSRWLPDGSGVIAAANKAGEEVQLWFISYPTGQARQLSYDLDGYFGPCLSADGRTLVAARFDSKASVWLAPGDKPDQAQETTAVTRRSHSDGRIGVGLSWTPDNRLLYITEMQSATTLWTMDRSGGDQRHLPVPDGAPRISSPKLTPDGKYLLFASMHKGVGSIWRMDADGSNLRQLITLRTGPLPFDCSPDGQWIIYDNILPGQGGRLWKMRIDGSNQVQLTDVVSSWPSISPDGKQIAFSYDDKGEELRAPNFGVIPFDGGPVTKIAEIPRTARFPNYQFKWMPDGRAVAFLDQREGVSNIWTLPLSGGEPRPLTHFKSNGVYAFAWSRDGQTLALWRGNRTTDVVLLSEGK